MSCGGINVRRQFIRDLRMYDVPVVSLPRKLYLDRVTGFSRPVADSGVVVPSGCSRTIIDNLYIVEIRIMCVNIVCVFSKETGIEVDRSKNLGCRMCYNECDLINDGSWNKVRSNCCDVRFAVRKERRLNNCYIAKLLIS